MMGVVDRDVGKQMRLISKREAGELLGMHPESVARLSRAGQFPKPIKVGSSANCRVRYDADEVDAWLVERKAARA
jgi:predicted DNA-binding transcriptional regulator AlpA